MKIKAIINISRFLRLIGFFLFGYNVGKTPSEPLVWILLCVLLLWAVESQMFRHKVEQ